MKKTAEKKEKWVAVKNEYKVPCGRGTPRSKIDIKTGGIPTTSEKARPLIWEYMRQFVASIGVTLSGSGNATETTNEDMLTFCWAS